MARFRLVYLATTAVRIMEHAADSPAAWAFELSSTERVLVRDVVDQHDEVQRHQRLCLLVTCEGEDLDDELEQHARSLAETTLILLSAAGRAPTGDAEFFVGYEISDERDGRQFLQWLPAPELPEPRTPVPEALMGAIWDAINAATSSDPPLAQRAVLSMSLYRRSARETEVLFRFTNLWLALEAMNPRLADVYGVADDERQGLAGAKRLVDEVTGDPTVFGAAVKARNDLLHANRVLPEEIRRRVQPQLADLDRSVIAGWRKILSLPETLIWPASSVWPYPNRYVLRAVLQPDVEGWSEDRHPWFDMQIALEPKTAERLGQITYSQSAKFTMHNATNGSQIRFEQRGADSPHAPRVVE